MEFPGERYGSLGEGHVKQSAEEPELWVPCDRTCSHLYGLVCGISPGDDV